MPENFATAWNQLGDETREFLFQIELRAMWREVGAILGHPVGWRG